ncbi:MAG TPA: Mur ligase family protein [Candidatus Saccharimonadales bacterium]|nr:Mur ligase family protein [Candidatus Saccharimonadales bacterium]
MSTIRNFADARHALQSFYNQPGSNTYTLERMRDLMHFLGDPQNTLKVIHVAGTSGKTSTAYYASSLLEASGATVGLSVSPHVDEVNERVQINRMPLPEVEFCARLASFMQEVGRSGIKPSYFELMVAFAYAEFARRKVDYAVMEVGLGGLLDATNVVARPDKVCIITDIGLDHVEVLGDTLPEIAAQKAGIITPGNPVFAHRQAPEIMAVFEQAARRENAVLHIVEPVQTDDTLADLPLFQQRNFHLADQAIAFTLDRDCRAGLAQEAHQTAAHIHIPGRMDTVVRRGKTIIFDGAHNEQKMTAFMQSVQAAYPHQPLAAVVAFVKHKSNRWQLALEVLIRANVYCIVTSFNLEPDDRIKQSIPAQAIADYFVSRGYTSYEVEPDLAKAGALLLRRPEPLLLVTGSFYMLHDARLRMHL